MNNNENTIGDGVVGAGPHLAYPINIASVSLPSQNNDGNTFAVVDNGQEAIILVEGKTGNRRILSGKGIGEGVDFVAPVNLVHVPSSIKNNEDDNTHDKHLGEMVVVDVGVEALVRVDMASGNRAILSGPQKGRGPKFSDLRDISLDTQQKNGENNITIVVSDHSLSAIFKVDYQTGNRTIVSSTSDEKGSGPSLKSPCGVTVLPDGDYIAMDAGLLSLVRIDRDTGDRSILSGPNIGEGPSFINPTKVLYNEYSGEQLIVVDGGLKALVLVNVQTGDRKILTGPSRGEGIKPGLPHSVAVPTDSKAQYVVLCDLGHEAVIRVDLSTGNRTVLSTARSHDSDRFKFPVNITTSTTAAAASSCPNTNTGDNNNEEEHMVVDTGGKSLVRVHPITGARTVLSSNDNGTKGPPLSAPRSIAAIGNGDYVYIDIDHHSVFRLCGTTGDRTLLSGPERGAGKALVSLRTLIVSASGDVIVADIGSKSLLRIDPATGDRTVICDQSKGTGPATSVVNGIVELENGNFVIIDNAQKGLLEIDAATGDRTVLFNNKIRKCGPGLKVPFALVPSGPQKYMVADVAHKGLVEIDVSTRESRIVSSPHHGTGPKIITPFGLTRNAKGNYIVVDVARKALLEVCPETGDRVILSE